MSKFGNVQTPYDPYSGVQLSYVRNTGLRPYHFNNYMQPARYTPKNSMRNAILCLAGMVIGIFLLNVV